MDLLAARPSLSTDEEAAAWPVDRLIDHIVNSHHAYMRAAMPAIASYLERLVRGQGKNRPELARAAESFANLRSDLEQHLLKEERVLFPYVRDLGARARSSAAPAPSGAVESPIQMMEDEHRDARERLARIRQVMGSCTFHDGDSVTYAVCSVQLDEFEADLVRHTHLESDVLFPKAIELERLYR